MAKATRALECASARRLRPTSTIAGLMSQSTARQPCPLISSTRRVMSPVPPATSTRSKRRADFGGASQATRSSFHSRCRPPDIKSFIRS
jgi:hypothetical protein